MIATAASAPLVGLGGLAASIWIGGMAATFVLARVALRVLEPAQRVALFRAFGRAWGIVGSLALLVALASAAALLCGHPWDALLIATAIVAAALLVASGAGMMQARAMTRLRQRALEETGGSDLSAAVGRGARLATALRSAITLLTLALLVLGSALVAQ